MIYVYLAVSLFGLIVCNILSDVYDTKSKSVYFFVFIVISLPFGGQHFSIFFESQPENNWLLLIPMQELKVDSKISFLSLLFLVLHVLTIPSSKITKLFIYVSSKLN